MHRRVAVVAMLLSCVAAGPAQAHKLKVFATAVGPLIEGTVYFVGSGPVEGARVSVTTPAGEPIGTLAADERGRFTFTASARVDHVFAVDPGDGHVARVTVPARDLPETLPAPPGAAAASLVIRSAASQVVPITTAPPGIPPDALRDAVGAVVAQQIQPLREQLNRYEDQVRLRDVVGGLGYIVGLAGLALWLKAGRRRQGGQ